MQTLFRKRKKDPECTCDFYSFMSLHALNYDILVFYIHYKICLWSANCNEFCVILVDFYAKKIKYFTPKHIYLLYKIVIPSFIQT
jgi:peptidoglycan biosynthesis protein MviN/MurJ (putative lipid II flippase)